MKRDGEDEVITAEARSGRTDGGKQHGRAQTQQWEPKIAAAAELLPFRRSHGGLSDFMRLFNP